jgi:hypothetical protein
MRTPFQDIYDDKGTPLCEDDLIRVYHFRTTSKKYWMYKRVFRSVDGYWMAEHYPFGKGNLSKLENCYCLQVTDETHLDGVTVVASAKHDHEDRRKVKANRFNG